MAKIETSEWAAVEGEGQVFRPQGSRQLLISMAVSKQISYNRLFQPFGAQSQCALDLHLQNFVNVSCNSRDGNYSLGVKLPAHGFIARNVNNCKKGVL